MKIRRWRYTKFAKIWALPEGAPKTFSRLAVIARHGGPPINLFVIPILIEILEILLLLSIDRCLVTVIYMH